MRILIGFFTTVLGLHHNAAQLAGIMRVAPNSGGAGLLRAENVPKHARFLNLAESMDPLESRNIDPLVGQQALLDEVNYLRSYAVEECRSLVCSAHGKARFSECADSLLSVDKQCRAGCQDQLRMWVFHRCYLIEAFDCSGNIGAGSLNPIQLGFNQNGPQTLAEFETNILVTFNSKGVNCQCCDFNDVLAVNP